MNPIYFAQTREDPFIEIVNISPPSKICIVGSAGDTLCSIICVCDHPKLSIDVVDINQDQLMLAKLKFGVIQCYDGFGAKLFLENTDSYYTENDYIIAITKMFSSGKIDAPTFRYWFEHIDFLIPGVINIGRFEQLFRDVMTDHNFEKHFSNENLTKIFGENATKNSTQKSFAKHFEEINDTYLREMKRHVTNYFADQFLFGKYYTVPFFLKHFKVVYVKSSVKFYQNNMFEHLKQNKNTYDLIQLSNITDWMDPIQFVESFQICYDALLSKGIVIVRRLNSDTVLETYFLNHPLFEFKLIKNEKSYFYSEVAILTKRSEKLISK